MSTANNTANVNDDVYINTNLIQRNETNINAKNNVVCDRNNASDNVKTDVVSPGTSDESVIVSSLDSNDNNDRDDV